MCFRFKWPATTNERRQTQSRGCFLDVDGYEVKIRGCRNYKNLPNAYDDVVSMGSGRTWKNNRKTRWKNK